MSVVVALLLDAWWREPPSPAHPVVAMGAYLEAAGRRIPSVPRRRARAGGAAAWLVGAVLIGAVAVTVQRALRRLPRGMRALATGVALWPLLSLRLLVDEVEAVEATLAGGDVEAARRRVARIVSRDTTDLSDVEVRAAALGSLAENLSDSLVASLLWFVVAGLSGAAVYRYVNTADAMWGYRSQDWCWAGTAAARADDLANLLPARVTALLLAAPAVPVPVLRREAARTASPNAGWPMAALALRLGVRLPKRGVYVVNPAGRQPGAAEAAAAVRLVWHAGLVAGAAAAAVAGVTRERGWRRG